MKKRKGFVFRIWCIAAALCMTQTVISAALSVSAASGGVGLNKTVLSLGLGESFRLTASQPGTGFQSDN